MGAHQFYINLYTVLERFGKLISQLLLSDKSACQESCFSNYIFLKA